MCDVLRAPSPLVSKTLKKALLIGAGLVDLKKCHAAQRRCIGLAPRKLRPLRLVRAVAGSGSQSFEAGGTYVCTDIDT